MECKVTRSVLGHGWLPNNTSWGLTVRLGQQVNRESRMNRELVAMSYEVEAKV